MWNKDMLGFLEYWSETLQMGEVKVTGATIQKNASGMDTVSLAATPTITGYIINPKDYNLNQSVGDDSSSSNSVRISGGVDALASVAGDNTMLTVKIGSASGKIGEHTDFTVTFVPVRTDTGMESPSRMSTTLRYNTPPRAPLQVIWDAATNAYSLLKGTSWEPTTGTNSDKDGWIYWGWPQGLYTGSSTNLDETDPDCVEQFIINGKRYEAQTLKQSETIASGSATYEVYGFKVGSGVQVSLAAMDNEGVTGKSVQSGVAPYTITLEAGSEGFFDGNEKTTYLYLQGGSSIRASDLPKPQAPALGRTFGGWVDGSGTPIQFPYEVRGNVTLTAKWDVVTYIVKYNGNGADAVAPMADQEIMYGSGTTLARNTFTRNGYTFGGWKRDNTGSNIYTDGADGSRLTDISGSTVTLYAQWKANTYTVEFHTNGGNGTMGKQDLIYDDATQKLSKNLFTRSGYAFKGWNTLPDGGGVFYSDEQPKPNVTPGNGVTMTLYAQWIQTVYYVDNSGGSDSNSGLQGSPMKSIGEVCKKIEDERGFEYTIYLLSNCTGTGSGYVMSFGNTDDSRELNVTITSADSTTKTIDGEQKGPVLYVGKNTHVTLRNVIVENGSTAHVNTKLGGGVYVNGDGTLILESGTIIRNNTADSGGGIYNSGGTVTVKSGATITGNTAVFGGGIYNASILGRVTVEQGATISSNNATGNGKGIYSDFRMVTGEDNVADGVTYKPI